MRIITSRGKEGLLKALLRQILLSIRSRRLLVECLDYHLFYRWFVGPSIADPM
uniref:Transposase InsH N-terminal domain-containing protein n=1 Tax=Aromatoleum anaerobium TaxID=182180 RepID=A0ABX1PFT0_9RHOO